MEGLYQEYTPHIVKEGPYAGQTFETLNDDIAAFYARELELEIQLNDPDLSPTEREQFKADLEVTKLSLKELNDAISQLPTESTNNVIKLDIHDSITNAGADDADQASLAA